MNVIRIDLLYFSSFTYRKTELRVIKIYVLLTSLKTLTLTSNLLWLTFGLIAVTSFAWYSLDKAERLVKRIHTLNIFQIFLHSLSDFNWLTFRVGSDLCLIYFVYHHYFNNEKVVEKLEPFFILLVCVRFAHAFLN